jgi:hypothetical protein
MSLSRRAITLYGADGVELSVLAGVAIPAGTKNLLVAGSDGTNAQTLRIATGTGLRVSAVPTRLLNGAYSAATALIAGTAGVQNLASIENPVASGRTVFVTRVQLMGVSNSTANAKFLYRVGRSSGVPTGGSTLGIQEHRLAGDSPVAIARSGPTATAATGDMWVGTPGVFTTGTPATPVALDAFRGFRETDDITLAAGEGLLVRADGNDTDWSHSVVFSWQEGAE